VTKAQSLRADFEKAVARLDEALALPRDPCGIPRSSGLRFHSSYAGSSSRRISKKNICRVHLAPDVFPFGIQTHVIDDDPFWIDVTVLLNYTVHTYNEQLAD